jgi:hypothetical protein
VQHFAKKQHDGAGSCPGGFEFALLYGSVEFGPSCVGCMCFARAAALYVGDHFTEGLQQHILQFICKHLCWRMFFGVLILQGDEQS